MKVLDLRKKKGLSSQILFVSAVVLVTIGLVSAVSALGVFNQTIENIENAYFGDLQPVSEQVSEMSFGASKTAPSHVTDSYSTTSQWDTGYFWGDLEVKDDFWVDDDATIGGDLALTGGANVGNLTYGLTTVASSTANAAETLLITDLTSYSGFDYTPGNLAVTLTLPATSTMTAFIPNAGECFDWRLRNLDGTAATSTTIAAGTGIDLVENENGDVIIEGGNEAQLKFCRELDTDVTVYVDEYIAAD